jgi:hypothetical protein
MFHFYSMNREAYMDKYHKRSNVESVFSMVKAKFRDAVRSKSHSADLVPSSTMKNPGMLGNRPGFDITGGQAY